MQESCRNIFFRDNGTYFRNALFTIGNLLHMWKTVELLYIHVRIFETVQRPTFVFSIVESPLVSGFYMKPYIWKHPRIFSLPVLLEQCSGREMWNIFLTFSSKLSRRVFIFHYNCIHWTARIKHISVWCVHIGFHIGLRWLVSIAYLTV